jgi:hypothetical protein
MSEQHVPEVGGEIWLIQKDGKAGPTKYRYQGQTSRSWLVGYSWKPNKKAKKDYQPISEEDALRISAEIAWSSKHRWKISEAVRYKADFATLRQIAALVGYKESA